MMLCNGSVVCTQSIIVPIAVVDAIVEWSDFVFAVRWTFGSIVHSYSDQMRLLCDGFVATRVAWAQNIISLFGEVDAIIRIVR